MHVHEIMSGQDLRQLLREPPRCLTSAFVSLPAQYRRSWLIRTHLLESPTVRLPTLSVVQLQQLPFASWASMILFSLQAIFRNVSVQDPLTLFISIYTNCSFLLFKSLHYFYY